VARSRRRDFPRPFGRGLIEALDADDRLGLRSPFRGHLAAASLKLRLPRDGFLIDHAFRGHLAAASLKRVDGARDPITVVCFPRPFGRGLIEAPSLTGCASSHPWRGLGSTCKCNTLTSVGWMHGDQDEALPAPVG
jgi:hypothetical protein